MTTIYWLSIMGAVCFYVYFFLTIFGLWAIKKGYNIEKYDQTSIIQHLMVKDKGVIYYIKWRWLLIAIAFTIVAVTI